MGFHSPAFFIFVVEVLLVNNNNIMKIISKHIITKSYYKFCFLNFWQNMHSNFVFNLNGGSFKTF